MIFLELVGARRKIKISLLSFMALGVVSLANASAVLKKSKDWISNGLIRVTAPESNDRRTNKNKFLVLCDLKNVNGDWIPRLYLRDNGSAKMSLHDEANEAVRTKVEKGKYAELVFKKVDKKQVKRKSGKNLDGEGAWREYKISIFPGSYEVRVECSGSSINKACRWYVMGVPGNICEYLMTETDIKDAADCESGLTSIKVGDPAYAVLWGINSECLFMVHWAGMKKASAWRNKSNKTWCQFITNTERPLSIYLHQTKKMTTDKEIKKLCGKMLRNNNKK